MKNENAKDRTTTFSACGKLYFYSDAARERWRWRETRHALSLIRRRRRRRWEASDAFHRRRPRGGLGGRRAGPAAGTVDGEAQRPLPQPQSRLRLLRHLGIPNLLLRLSRVPLRQLRQRRRCCPREACCHPRLIFLSLWTAYVLLEK